MVHPEEEELVLAEGVQGAERRPEQELVHSEREATSEQVGRSLLEGNPQKGLSGRSVVSSQLLGPRLVSVVGPACVLERHNQRGCW